MAEVRISETIRLDLPPSVDARQRPEIRRRGQMEANNEIDAALADADYEIDAVIELTPMVPVRDRRQRAVPESGGKAAEPQLMVDVGPDESAVVLLESEGGVFAWLIPEKPAGPRRGGGGTRTLIFPLANPAHPGGTPGFDRRGRRGIVSWIGNQLIAPIRVRVLRFTAGLAIDLIMDRIEGGRTFGLVDMAGPSSSWKPGVPMPALPTAGPARILLMLHGTFSSTAGSFAALEASDEGRAFLAAARDEYDAIIGFDHKTLAEDPAENAAALLKELKHLPVDSRVDAIGYSRGGLVLRVLAERLAPAARPDLKFEEAVFVGCTNGGTHLADPDNWGALVDFYTNIFAAGARAIALISANPAAEMVRVGVAAVGRFVKYLPELAVSQGNVPGLAAMEPDGEFVLQLNGDDPSHGASSYHVIASDFEPRIEPSRGITGEVAEYLVDRIVDRLFKGVDNDLVVDTSSMSKFGRQAERMAATSPALIPPEECVFHTIYFASSRVAGLLGDLLLGIPRRRSLSMPRSTAPVRPPLMPRQTVPSRQPADRRGQVPPFERDALRRTSTGFGSRPQSSGLPRPMRGVAPPRPPAPNRGSRALRSAGGSPGTVDTSANFACHFAAEMQPTPLVGLPTYLFVTISPERLDVAASPTTAATVAAVLLDQMKPIEVEVIPSRNCRIFGTSGTEPPKSSGKREEGASLRIINVPAKGSVSLRFEVEGLAPGEAEIFIEARQESRLLASFLLKPIFTLESDARISASQVAHPTLAGQEDPAVLRIYEMHLPDGALRLRFELSCEDPSILVQDDVTLRANFNVGAFVASFLTMLEEAYGLADYDLTLRKISTFSMARTEELIPLKVRERLWKHREKIRAVQIVSEQPLIPWELLYVSDPTGKNKVRQGFLAEWGLFRWMYNADWPSRTLSFGKGRVFHVIPDYLNPDNELKGAAEERNMLATRFPGAKAIEPTSEKVIEFLQEGADQCDLLHFACHGIAEQKAVLSSDLVLRERETAAGLTDDSITQDDVKMDAAFGERSPGAMVFINSCQTGRDGEGIAGVMGFADAFIRPRSQEGASVFIGALWSVSDTLALTFADTFYGELLDGKALVDAARAAREACKQRDDFTWLAYSLYGHPFAKVVQ